MKADKLQMIFKYIEFLEFENYQFTRHLELYNYDTEESKRFKSIDDALEYKIGNETLSDKLDKIKFEWIYSGGRGAGVDGMGDTGFNTSRYGGEERNTIPLHPAEFNKQGRFTTQERAIKEFERKYANADREYGISIDTDGFVHSHVRGGKSSVAIAAHGKNHMVVHNHPSGSAFSGVDLISIARDRKSSGLIATGRKGRYTLTKNKNFKADEFTRAVKKSKFPKKMNYDEGARWWLKRNAKKYGYKFEFKEL